jgi:hypothetical protein
MQEYDPLVEILQVAEESCEFLGEIGKSGALRNLQIVLRAPPSLSKELQKRMAATLRHLGQSHYCAGVNSSSQHFC